jgi:TadE-like protein
MVEFALVAPLLMSLFLALADMSRGLLAYTEMAAAARAGGREAVLQYNAGSNFTAPGCNPTSCNVPGVAPMIRRLASFGFNVVYADSTAVGSPPAYGQCIPSCPTGATAPLTNLQLNPATTDPNTLYVFVYELDSVSGDPSPRWACACAPPVRTGGNQTTVVDLKMRWTPLTLSLLGLSPPAVQLDSQTVERIEF